MSAAICRSEEPMELPLNISDSVLSLAIAAHLIEAGFCQTAGSAAGATFALIEPNKHRDVEIPGTLRTNVHATGTVVIHTCRLLQGEVHGSHLVIDDGGGLRGIMEIGPHPGSSPR